MSARSLILIPSLEIVVATYYFYVNCHYLVQFLVTDLKHNKGNNKKKTRQISSYLKRYHIIYNKN